MKKRSLSPRTLGILAVVGVLLYGGLGWKVLVSPKHAAGAELDAQIAETGILVAQARARANGAAQPPKITVADIFRLAKAMPSQVDMPGILLELSEKADETGISFDSITPSSPVANTGYVTVPVNLVFSGNFYELSDFLFRLRTLVSVHDRRLHATGRLFSVETISFAESQASFPDIQATLGLSAFVYGTDGAADVPPAAAATPAPSSAEPSPNVPPVEGATAAGATP